jgi:hypothetical protein
MRTMSEWIASDERKRVLRHRSEQTHITRLHDPNRVNYVGALVHASVPIEPFELNSVALGDVFKRPEPTRAMAGHE